MYFFVQNIQAGSVKGDDADHMIAMRLKVGEIVTITDQDGEVAQVKITAFDKRNRFIHFDILNSQTHEKPQTLEVYQAVLDKQYMDKCIEILTLTAVTDMYFFSSEFSVDRQLNPIRFERIITRSCEQSELLFRPRVHYITYNEMLQKITKETALCTHTYSEGGQSISDDDKAYQLLVGPEGGWSESEIQTFTSMNIRVVSLGNRVYPGWLAGFVGIRKYFPQHD